MIDLRYKITDEERNLLYNEVWTDPVTTVAKRYNLSDNGLRKHCKKYGIPLPPAGYWARIRAGQKVKKPPLSKITGEIKNHIKNYVIKYIPNYEQLTEAELRNKEELSLLKEETRAFIKDICSKLQVTAQLRNPHRLIIEHQEETICRKNPDKRVKGSGSRILYSVRINGQYCTINAMLPIYVSTLNIKRAYRILNTIINTLEDMESYVHVSYEFDSNKDTGSFSVMGETIKFELSEKVRKQHKSDSDHLAYLVLSLLPQSGFKRKMHDKIEYQDYNNVPLETQVGKIIYDMFVIANQLRCIDILDEREYKKQREEEERQRRLEDMRKGQLEEIKLLEQAASDWHKSQEIRQFADALELKTISLTDGPQKEKIVRWLQWARDKADWLDPLTDKVDDLLGKGQYLFDCLENKDRS